MLPNGSNTVLNQHAKPNPIISLHIGGGGEVSSDERGGRSFLFRAARLWSLLLVGELSGVSEATVLSEGKC